jgi:predicted DCC family thiol-disulfide oxidoreductase YuxK
MNIVFFDGYCTLCNAFIDFLVKIDRKQELKFASLQGETAKKFQLNFSEAIDPNTVIYFRNGQSFEKSKAILMIFEDLGYPWKCAKIFAFIPEFARNKLYDFVAKHRYQLFGKKKTCRLPTETERAQFLP